MNSSDLSGIVAAHDIVISLLPATMHVKVAKVKFFAPHFFFLNSSSKTKECIAHGRHMITTSYVSPEMAELHEQAVAKGVTILNEVGLDPGIDHLTAMRVIRDCHDKGGTVTRFTSYCGGLPAPEGL